MTVTEASVPCSPNTKPDSSYEYPLTLTTRCSRLDLEYNNPHALPTHNSRFLVHVTSHDKKKQKSSQSSIVNRESRFQRQRSLLAAAHSIFFLSFVLFSCFAESALLHGDGRDGSDGSKSGVPSSVSAFPVRLERQS